MSVCALAAGRLCDGVPSLPARHLVQDAAALSLQCYAAAVKAMPNDMSSVPDYFQTMRAEALLVSTCLQNRDPKRAIAHLGEYVSLSVSNGFHDEANWPEGLSEIQKQERRRLVRT